MNTLHQGGDISDGGLRGDAMAEIKDVARSRSMAGQNALGLCGDSAGAAIEGDGIHIALQCYAITQMLAGDT